MAIFDLENSDGVPIYVHSKVCIVDDVWMSVGSDNLNRRSWTHDSESSSAIVNTESDPDGHTLARATRLRFATEHLGRADVDDLVVPSRWFDAFRDSARVLDAWHRDGQAGPRPSGHVRVHDREHVGPIARFGLDVVHRVVLDPDGRPFRMRRSERY